MGAASILCPLITATLLVTASRCAWLWWLAWGALLPLGASVVLAADWRTTVAGAFIGGTMFYGALFDFVALLGAGSTGSLGPHVWLWFGLACCGGAQWLVVAAIFRLLVVKRRWPAMIAFPLVWVFSEQLIQGVGLHVLKTSAMPACLAITQVDCPVVLQIADLGGSAAIAWLLCTVQGTIIDAVILGRRNDRSSRLCVAIAALELISAVAFGSWRLAGPLTAGPGVVLVPSGFALSAQKAIAFTRTQAPDAALVIWPETADPRYTYEVHADTSHEDFHAVANGCRIPIIVGFFRVQEQGGIRVFNSVLLIEPGIPEIQHYDKQYLTPFLEFNPFERVPLARSFGEMCTQPRPVPLQPGSLQTAIRLNERQLSIGVGICHDVYFDAWGTALVSGQPSPDFIVQCADEARDQSRQVQDLLMRCVRIRAVACRRSIVRCVRGGISGLVSPFGQPICVRETWGNAQPFLVPSVPLETGRSVYSFLGQKGVMLILGVVASVSAALFPVRHICKSSFRSE